MTPTLVFIRSYEVDGRTYVHGDELIPGTLSKETVDKLLDAGWLKEYPERRSLYRIFPMFSGCKETEHLEKNELDAYALSS